MKLAVFGATGSTGEWLVNLGLRRGHTLYVLVRDPGRLKVPDDLTPGERRRLHVTVGDVADVEAVASVVKHADVVLEALGAQRNRLTHIKREGLRAIIAAMKKHGKRRLIAITSGSARQHASPLLQQATSPHSSEIQ